MSLLQNIKISLKLRASAYLIFLVIICFSHVTGFAQSEKFKVVLDAGHGGKDPGTLGKGSYKGSYESDIALKVTLQVGKLLETNADFQTIYTRKKDVFIPLHKRGSIANKADADLFISIHCNSAVTNAYGTTTYVLGMGKTAKNLELAKRENDVILLEDDYEKHYDYDPNSEEFMIGLTLMQEDYLDKSIEFAQIVQNKFVSVAKRKNRGVNQGNLAVLYDSYMPSVLIEIGFLTNKAEEKFLHTKSGQLKISKAIYEAVKTYKKRLDNNSIDSSAIADNSSGTSDSQTEATLNVGSSYYKVQIATSKNKIDTQPNNFKKLKGVERIQVGDVYKYYYGRSNNLIEIRKVRKEVVKKGYKDAFIKRFVHLPKKEVVEDNTTNVSSTHTPEHYYSVQFATSTKKIALKPYNFKGLSGVFRKKVGTIYKYFYGKANTVDEARKIRTKVVRLGYKDAFVKKLVNEKAEAIPNVVKETKTTSNNTFEGIVFKVQITSGRRKIETKSYNFRGLKNIERVKIGEFYKYYYGKTNNYDIIVDMHKEAKEKGYSDAQIVAIKNNRLISVNSLINSK